METVLDRRLSALRSCCFLRPPVKKPPDLRTIWLNRCDCSPAEPPEPPDPPDPVNFLRCDLNPVLLLLCSYLFRLLFDRVILWVLSDHRSSHLTDEKYSDGLYASQFHRGNGSPYVKWLHHLSQSAVYYAWIGHATYLYRPLTGSLPVRCRAPSPQGSYEVNGKTPLFLGLNSIWAWPNKICGIVNPQRSISGFTSVPSLLSIFGVNLASICTSLMRLVSFRMFKTPPTSSLYRVVVKSEFVPRGTKNWRSCLLAFVDIGLCLEVATELALTSVGDRNLVSKSPWQVIHVRVVTIVVNTRLTHPRFILDPLSIIFRDETTIFYCALMLSMYFSLKLEVDPPCTKTMVE